MFHRPPPESGQPLVRFQMAQDQRLRPPAAPKMQALEKSKTASVAGIFLPGTRQKSKSHARFQARILKLRPGFSKKRSQIPKRRPQPGQKRPLFRKKWAQFVKTRRNLWKSARVLADCVQDFGKSVRDSTKHARNSGRHARIPTKHVRKSGPKRAYPPPRCHRRKPRERRPADEQPNPTPRGCAQKRVSLEVLLWTAAARRRFGFTVANGKNTGTSKDALPLGQHEAKAASCRRSPQRATQPLSITRVATRVLPLSLWAVGCGVRNRLS